MKNLLLPLLLIALTACPRQTPEDDPEPASLSFEAPVTAGTLYGNVTLRAMITNDAEPEAVRFFVDDQLIATDSLPPYEVLWDSRTVADGSHTLALGTGQPDTEQSVTIDNSLVTASLDDPLLEAGDYLWVFASDSTGQPLGEAQKLENGSGIDIRRPENFEGKRVTVNLLQYYESEREPRLELFTYPDIPFGEFRLGGIGYREGPAIGNVYIAIANAPDSLQRIRVQSSDWLSGSQRLTTNEQTALFESEVTKAEDRLLVYTHYGWAREDPVFYYLSDPLAPGDTVHLDYAEFIVAHAVYQAENEGLTYVAIDGYLEKYEGIYPMGTDYHEGGRLSVDYLPEGFDFYRTHRWHFHGNREEYQQKIGSVAQHFETLPVRVSQIETQNSTHYLQISGDFDFYELSISGHKEVGNEYRIFSWTVLSNAPELSLTSPRLPATLAEHYARFLEIELDVWRVEAVDMEDWNGYKDFLAQTLYGGKGISTETLFRAPEISRMPNKSVYIYADEEDVGFRKSNREHKQHLGFER